MGGAAPAGAEAGQPGTGIAKETSVLTSYEVQTCVEPETMREAQKCAFVELNPSRWAPDAIDQIISLDMHGNSYRLWVQWKHGEVSWISREHALALYPQAVSFQRKLAGGGQDSCAWVIADVDGCHVVGPLS